MSTARFTDSDAVDCSLTIRVGDNLTTLIIVRVIKSKIVINIVDLFTETILSVIEFLNTDEKVNHSCLSFRIEIVVSNWVYEIDNRNDEANCHRGKNEHKKRNEYT